MRRHIAKRRAPQGQLENLTYDARQKLHSWLREDGGTITFKEVQRRIASEFDMQVATSSLSVYYKKHARDITNPEGADRAASASPKVIVIRIEVPSGCQVDVTTTSTETAGAEGTGS